MPFDRSTPIPTTIDPWHPRGGPWSNDLVHLVDDRALFSESSAEAFGLDGGFLQGLQLWKDEPDQVIATVIDGKLRKTFVNGAPERATLGIGSFDKPEPGYMEAVEAAFRTENMIGSGFASVATAIPEGEFFKRQPGYDVYEDIKGYEPYMERFEQVYNPIAAQAVKSDIDRENSDREILAASGFVPWALSIGAATIADPTILIPGGAFVKGGRLGYSVGKTAVNVGAHAGLATGVQEGVLHSTQQTRTIKESLAGIGGSMLLGGVIGTAGARIVPLDEIGSTAELTPPAAGVVEP